ncbi:MAG: DUF2382 domain-containing protein [Pseudomonadota bacterium]
MNPTSPSPEPIPPSPAGARDEGLVIPVVREELEVERVVEHVGTVRLRKRIHHVSEPVDASGFREVVETLRVPVNEPAERREPPWQDGETLVIPVYEERLVTQLFVVEELRVVRRREFFGGQEDVDLRQEEVIVERLDPATQQWIPDVR